VRLCIWRTLHYNIWDYWLTAWRCTSPLTILTNWVTYKLAVLTFNVRLTATPAYLNSLISNRATASRMSLRSSTRSLMAVPRTNTVCVSRSFSVCAPVVWNSLSPEVQLCSCLKTFKSTLKTFYFVEPLTFDRSQRASVSSDFTALYKLFYLPTYSLSGST